MEIIQRRAGMEEGVSFQLFRSLMLNNYIYNQSVLLFKDGDYNQGNNDY